VANEHLRKIGVNPPIVRSIRVGQSASRNPSPKTRVIQLGFEGPQTGLDVPQAFPKGELRKRQTQELVATGKTSWPPIPSIPRDTLVELATGQKLHQLRKHELTLEHKTSPTGKNLPRRVQSLHQVSSRVQTLYLPNPCEISTSDNGIHR